MTRFHRLYVNSENLTEKGISDILGHFGANPEDVAQTFPNWNKTLTFVVSTDKSDKYMKLLTDGKYVKVPESDSAMSVSGTYPVVIIDPKYQLLNFIPGVRLDRVNCVRFAVLKSNQKPTSLTVEPMTPLKINLDRPTQQDVTRLTAEVDPEKLKNTLNAWPEEFTKSLLLPRFEKVEPKAEPPLSNVPPSAPEKNDPHDPENVGNNGLTPFLVDNMDDAAHQQIAMLTEAMIAMQSEMKAMNLNNEENALMVQPNQDQDDKVVLSKSTFTVPRVDLDVNGSMADALDSLISMTRLIDVRSHKHLILQFLTSNLLTDIIPDLSDRELNDVRLFQGAMLERYGSPDPVAEFNVIQQRNLEDPSSLLHRIKRAWRRVKAMGPNETIPESELGIIRDRFIKSLKNRGLQTKLRIWDTPYNDMIRVSRDYLTAMKIEGEPSTLTDVMIAFDGCRHCGLAHDSDTCRSNAKQKTSWNKKVKNNRPVSRSPARIIPDDIGNDNRYQPVQRSIKGRDRSRSHDRRKDYKRQNGYNGYQFYQYSRSRSPQRNEKHVRFSTQKSRKFQNKRSPNQPKYRKPWSKFYNQKSTQAYLAMDEYGEEMEYPFGNVEVSQNCHQYC